MTRSVLLPIAAILTGCAGSVERSLDLESGYVITYYDRNRDGAVDFELHDIPGMADDAWALSDTKFRGRYDTRLKFGMSFQRERVDLAVPRNVKITPGKPLVFTTQ